MKNWTLRQRILASFAVIIAIMLLMVVVSYSRLLKIEASENSVRDDAIPGVYYSSMIRGAWVDSYLQTQELLGLKEGQGVSSEDAADYKSFEVRLQEQMANYRKTMATDEDRTEFAAFEKYHDAYIQIQDAVLDLHKRNLEADAVRMFHDKLTPAWYSGRMKLNDIIGENKRVADEAMNNIDEAVAAAKVSMFISLLVAVFAAGLCGLLLMRAIMAPMNRIVQIL